MCMIIKLESIKIKKEWKKYFSYSLELLITDTSHLNINLPYTLQTYIFSMWKIKCYFHFPQKIKWNKKKENSLEDLFLVISRINMEKNLNKDFFFSFKSSIKALWSIFIYINQFVNWIDASLLSIELEKNKNNIQTKGKIKNKTKRNEKPIKNVFQNINDYPWKCFNINFIYFISNNKFFIFIDKLL